MKLPIRALLPILPAATAAAAATNNILMTGYWPPTNEMVRHFSPNPTQNPGGWVGENWEGRGYDVFSYFPEFPTGELGKGVGDLEVDYQDTSQDFWRIVDEVQPVAIITFSRGSLGRTWEVEQKQRNLEVWLDDFEAPFQPNPAPPDSSVPAGYVRESTLPMQSIVDNVRAANPRLNAFIDRDGFGGGFLSEFIAYHGVWYQSLNADPAGDAWCVSAGHIHVGSTVSLAGAVQATEVTLRTLIGHVDSIVPEPGTLVPLGFGLALLLRRRSESRACFIKS